MKAVFCGGGTGGHVYPALTVAAALKRACGDEELSLLYIGVRGKIDAEIVAREGLPFRAVSAGPLRGRSLLATTLGVLNLLRGIIEAYVLLRSFRPDVVFATGGYGSVGVGLAARLRGVPLLLFLPDVQAGVAVKALVRFATRIAVTAAPALARMPAARTVLTGYPVRDAFFYLDKGEARRQLGFKDELPLLLVTGGSTGANAINRQVASWAREYLPEGQLLHVCGQNDFAWLQQMREALPDELKARYQLHSYLHNQMPLAFAAADLGVMRAGASVLGELPATGLPAVLVPGEFSDQADNARYLQDHGAALMLPQSGLADLYPLLQSLLVDQPRLESMREALKRLARPDAAQRLAGLMREAAGLAVKVAA